MKPDRFKGKTKWEKLRAKHKAAPPPSNEERTKAREFWADADVVIPGGKTRMTVRFDTDIVEWFKSSGPKYQTRMNVVLRQFVNSQRENTRGSAAVAKVKQLSSAIDVYSDASMASYMESLNQLAKIRKEQGDFDAAASYFEESANFYRVYLSLNEEREANIESTQAGESDITSSNVIGFRASSRVKRKIGQEIQNDIQQSVREQ
jgi:uncharacterized protein (DUF4415 family)